MESQSEPRRVTTEVYSSQDTESLAQIARLSPRKQGDRPLEKHGEQNSRKVTALRIKTNQLAKQVETLESTTNDLERALKTLRGTVVGQNFVLTALFLLTVLNWTLLGGLWGNLP